jgi:hypothetical protein
VAYTYTSALQGRIALAVWGVANSSLNTTQKTQLDGTWTSGALAGGAAYDAATEISQIAQWVQQSGTDPDTTFPQPAWDRLFVAKAAMILVKTVRPERLSEFQRDHEAATDALFDTYTSTTIIGSLGGQAISVAGIRAYVVRHCIKRANGTTGNRRRLFPAIADIDSHLQWTINYLGNVELWNFRKRQVQMKVTLESFSTGTWTESTNTLTCTGEFSNTNIAAGTMVLITGGTNVTAGLYMVLSRTSSDAIVLDTSITTSGNLATGDITGTVQVVTFLGMRETETFDSTATKRFYYDGENFGTTLEWADDDTAAALKAYWGSTTGQPGYFCTKPSASAISWHFMPNPDSDYTLRGAVYAAFSSTFADATAIETAIARFPTEFGPIIRDIVLARVLMQFGASDGESMWKRCEQQLGMLSQFVDQGMPWRDSAPGDVYGDISSMIGYENRGFIDGH